MPFFTESDSTIEGPETFSAIISNAPARVSFGASISTVDITEEQCEYSHAMYRCDCVVKGDCVSQCMCAAVYTYVGVCTVVVL